MVVNPRVGEEHVAEGVVEVEDAVAVAEDGGVLQT